MRTLTAFALILACVVPAKAETKKPNFVFIIADDQSPFDLKVYNPKSKLATPAISKLAAEGMTIDGAHHMGSWTGGVCTASRHMVMSGRSVWHIPDKPKNGRNPNIGNEKLVPKNLEQHTMPAVFNKAGYITMRTCKKGNSYEGANKLFTVRKDSTKRGGTPETGSAWHGEQVLDFLKNRQSNKESKKPFLIYFGFSHPHDVRDGTPELLEKYGAVNHRDKANVPPTNGNQPPLPVNYLPGHPFADGLPGLRDEVSVPGVWKRRDPVTMRNEIGRQFACSEYIDHQIARVRKQLEAMGELENTYIIYTSDHGMAIGRHGLQGKQNLYEHTWRVPFIVKGPGIKPGSRAQGNIYLLDVLGTLCDLAGVPAPPTCESASFRPVLEGKKDTVRDVVYGTYSGGTKPGMRSVKKGDWKLIKYDVLDGTVRKTQLFNLAENPWEYLSEHHAVENTKLTGTTPKATQKNLADDPAHAEKLKEMEALLLDQQRKLHDPYRLWNQPDDGLPKPKTITPQRKRKGKKGKKPKKTPATPRKKKAA